MTSTEQQQSERDYEFGVGDPCGVCHFPVGPGQICGNTVYANRSKGRLPAYCGMAGQEEWQAKHGTEGNKAHRSDVAKYPRDKFGMTKEETAALAEAESVRRGYTRRLKAEAPAAATAPVAAVPTVPATAPTIEDLVEALAESPIEALAQLTQLFVGRVGAARMEMETVRADADQRIADIESEATEAAERLAAERGSLEAERAEVQALRERAEAQIREANESRLRTEGELNGARQRITELEAEISEAEQRHRAEVEKVRREERENFLEGMKALGATYRAEAATVPQPMRETPVTDQAITDIGARVARNEATWREGKWHINNAAATHPVVRVLDHMREAGYLQVGSVGAPERVTLTETFPGTRPRRAH